MNFDLTDEQREIQQLARDIARREVAPFVREYDRGEYYPREHTELLARVGLLGGSMPEDVGGSGLDYVTLALVLEELAYACPTTAMICGQPSCSLGEGLLRYGTAETQERFLRSTLQGELVGAVAVTEAHSGTDISRRIETSVRRDGESYVLNGTKMWVSNCVNADWFLTFGVIDRGSDTEAVCAFAVEKASPGVVVNQFHNLVGGRTSATGEVVFQDVRVPSAQRIGDEADGLKVLMAGSESGRLACAARATGQLAACLDASVAYAREREVFGEPIGRYQLIQEKIAAMRLNLEAARLLVWRLAALKDDGHERLQQSASMAKLFATDALMSGATDAVQIYGAYGCSDEYPVGRYFRDAKFMQIYDGTNEIHRILIAEHELGYRGSGAVDKGNARVR